MGQTPGFQLHLTLTPYESPTADFRAKILHVCGADSIGILFLRGEVPQSTGNATGNSTRRILACELAFKQVAVRSIRKLRISESKILGRSLWTWEFHPLKFSYAAAPREAPKEVPKEVPPPMVFKGRTQAAPQELRPESHQDSSRGGAVETGCSGLHYIIGCFII